MKQNTERKKFLVMIRTHIIWKDRCDLLIGKKIKKEETIKKEIVELFMTKNSKILRIMIKI